MAIGQIISLPPGESQFARARDEYGNSYNVQVKGLPEAADVGDKYAYRVQFVSQHSSAQTLKLWEDD